MEGCSERDVFNKNQAKRAVGLRGGMSVLVGCELRRTAKLRFMKQSRYERSAERRGCGALGVRVGAGVSKVQSTVQ